MNKNIFALIGDFYHPYDNAFSTIKKAVEMNSAELIDGKIDEISGAIDANPDAILLYRENRINPEDATVNLWLTDELDEKITTYVKNGGSIIALHTAIALYPRDSKYTDMVKGYFIEHPVEHYLVRYKSTNTSGNPLGSPFDFTIKDEHYIVHVDEANTNVFMRHSSDYGEGCAAWHHNYGKGKVIVLVPTHNKEGFEHPQTLRLLNEAIAWSLKG